MRRRDFIALCGVTAAASPLRPAQAQKAGKTARVSVLSTGNPRSAPIYQAFEHRLHDLGYIEGQNLMIEFRDAEGKIDKLPGVAAELVGLNVDVIVVATDPATRAAKNASVTVPIVMVGVNFDPITLGYIPASPSQVRTSPEYSSFTAR